VFSPPPISWSEVPEQYQEIDAWFGELLEEQSYDYIVLVSDHGMTTRFTGTGLPGAHDPPHSEAHRGIFSITGPGVRAGVRIDMVSVLDVAPTVAYVLGMPVGRDLPGRLLEEVFEAERLELIAPTFVDSWD
jgi:arylsulfatase A-like enzyme